MKNLENSYGNWKPGWLAIFGFRRAWQGYAPRRTRVGGARHVLRGYWGVGMLLTCHPQVGGRFGQGGVEIEKNGKILKIPKVTGNRGNL